MQSNIAKTKHFRVNKQILSSEVVVIDEKGENIGTMSLNSAIELAKERGYDLVEVSPNISPPVCKIMDYGKYLYRLAKQKRQHNAKQKKVEVKGVRLSVRTEKHDLEFKARNIIKFIKKGNRVKIDLILKGREKANLNFAREKLENFLKIVSDIFAENKELNNECAVIKQDVKKTPQGFCVFVECKRK